MRILLVEDEVLVRELAYEDLCDAQHDVQVAADGDEALGILQNDLQFDVLVTDIKMPGSLDGWQLASKAKSMIPGLKVIYATGLASGERLPDGDWQLTKPYTDKALVGLIAEIEGA